MAIHVIDSSDVINVSSIPERVSGSAGRKSPSMTGERARLCTMGSAKDGQIDFALHLLWF